MGLCLKMVYLINMYIRWGCSSIEDRCENWEQKKRDTTIKMKFAHKHGGISCYLWKNEEIFFQRIQGVFCIRIIIFPDKNLDIQIINYLK